jgi:hypothetical protein
MSDTPELPDDVDVVVLSCWPKRLVEMEPYRGSVDGICALCSEELWIGARQQEVLVEYEAKHKQVEVVCIPCTVRLQAAREDRGIVDAHATLALGGEATTAGLARMDQLAKEIGVELP